jgi:hypothetical protein
LQSVYRNPDLPESLRAKAAGLALPVEKGKKQVQPEFLELKAEEPPLAEQHEAQLERMNRMLALPIEERSELFSPGRRNGNGSDGEDHS